MPVRSRESSCLHGTHVEAEAQWRIRVAIQTSASVATRGRGSGTSLHIIINHRLICSRYCYLLLLLLFLLLLYCYSSSIATPRYIGNDNTQPESVTHCFVSAMTSSGCGGKSWPAEVTGTFAGKSLRNKNIQQWIPVMSYFMPPA